MLFRRRATGRLEEAGIDDSTTAEASERTVCIAGAGRVGTLTAFTAMLNHVAERITLVDEDRRLAAEEALDLQHALPFPPPVDIQPGAVDDCTGADVIVLVPDDDRKGGEGTVEDLRERVAYLRSVIPRMTENASPDAVLVVVPGPVEVLTMAAADISGFQHSRVVGTGTAMETALLRRTLAGTFQVDQQDVNAYVIGQQGQEQLIPWSLASIRGVPLEEFARNAGRAWGEEERRAVSRHVQEASERVRRRHDEFLFSRALSTVRIVRAIVGDEHSVLTISSVIEKDNGHVGAALSLPSVVSSKGCESAVPLALSDREQEAFEHAARSVKDMYVRVLDGSN